MKHMFSHDSSILASKVKKCHISNFRIDTCEASVFGDFRAWQSVVHHQFFGFADIKIQVIVVAS